MTENELKTLKVGQRLIGIGNKYTNKGDICIYYGRRDNKENGSFLVENISCINAVKKSLSFALQKSMLENFALLKRSPIRVMDLL